MQKRSPKSSHSDLRENRSALNPGRIWARNPSPARKSLALPRGPITLWAGRSRPSRLARLNRFGKRWSRCQRLGRTRKTSVGFRNRLRTSLIQPVSLPLALAEKETGRRCRKRIQQLTASQKQLVLEDTQPHVSSPAPDRSAFTNLQAVPGKRLRSRRYSKARTPLPPRGKSTRPGMAISAENACIALGGAGWISGPASLAGVWGDGDCSDVVRGTER